MKVNEEDKSRIKNWQEKGCCLYLSHAWLFCDPMDCSPPGSPVCGTLQTRMLQWAAILLQGMESESLALQADSLSHLLTSQALHPFHLIFPTSEPLYSCPATWPISAMFLLKKKQEIYSEVNRVYNTAETPIKNLMEPWLPHFVIVVCLPEYLLLFRNDLFPLHKLNLGRMHREIGLLICCCFGAEPQTLLNVSAFCFA